MVKFGNNSPLLNLSSVIHEVYSYSHSSVIKKFWEKQVFGGSFKYITIRDMIPSVNIHKNEVSKFINNEQEVVNTISNNADKQKAQNSLDAKKAILSVIDKFAPIKSDFSIIFTIFVS